MHAMLVTFRGRTRFNPISFHPFLCHSFPCSFPFHPMPSLLSYYVHPSDPIPSHCISSLYLCKHVPHTPHIGPAVLAVVPRKELITPLLAASFLGTRHEASATLQTFTFYSSLRPMSVSYFGIFIPFPFLHCPITSFHFSP